MANVQIKFLESRTTFSQSYNCVRTWSPANNTPKPVWLTKLLITFWWQMACLFCPTSFKLLLLYKKNHDSYFKCKIAHTLVNCKNVLTRTGKPFAIWTEFNRWDGLCVTSKSIFQCVVRLLYTILLPCNFKFNNTISINWLLTQESTVACYISPIYVTQNKKLNWNNKRNNKGNDDNRITFTLCPRKYALTLASCSFNKHGLIFTIFGQQH